LSWNAKFSIDDICQDAWFWQKNNPDGYNIKD
jgi:UDP-glucose 4-epimerase